MRTYVVSGFAGLSNSEGSRTFNRVKSAATKTRKHETIFVFDRDPTVRVTLPHWGSKRKAAAFAEQERAWIEKQQRKSEQPGEHPEPAPLAPNVERELRDRAKRELPARLFELASEHGLTVARVSVRNQRWRWGSCSRKGHICLNWRLVQMPDSVRDYVMIHELMYLKRMDHSPRFWRLVAHVCPDFKSARASLRTYSNEHRPS